MARKPLPLQQINAFEAAARHLSFSRAAQELNVQQPAISRQVAALEEWLEVALFLRSKPRLTLTEEGQVLATAIAKGFDAMHAGFDAVQMRRPGGEIVVNAAIGFTSFYLLPRLAEFQALHPDIKVQVVTRDQNPDYDVARCDLVVVFGEGGVPGLRSVRVFPEQIVAVCHPDVLPSPDPVPLRDLADMPLLHMSGPAHVGDWDRYFDGTGLHAPKPPKHDRYLSYMVYLRAIQSGLGVGTGWRPMIDEFLSSGALVLACEHQCKTARGYFCSVTNRADTRPEVELFLNWISGKSC
ncbi:Glycine cleavage system transcriptional activator [Falsiruegeria litorea R37]|uniref:Glycine cleavage system transcriptional activator n=1 Tax=Falsiruegeria litorea R37 TaxID=1200284 RepID=A0A1Y5RVX1_9RHOB|nr:LysR substrate-binding domain-containing protein [Falsiruegeria litorea]SLN26423.1 Glycine cleavage system transcriptional activator [Falsiruegeria litorea R37]